MKAHKVTLLILDFDDVGKDIPEIIEDQKYPNRCLSPIVMGMESVEIGEWDDANPLNSSETMKKKFDELFNISREKEEISKEYNRILTLLREKDAELVKTQKECLENMNKLVDSQENCTIVGGDMKENIIELKFDEPDKVKGIKISDNAKIIIKRYK